MNKITKIRKFIISAITTIVIITVNFLGLQNSVYAAELINNAKLEKIGDCGSLLKYNGVTVVTTYVAYTDGGKTYPAYCLNVNLPGVGEQGSYNVSTDELISDVGLWRRVINGYPYKTLKELGCKTKEEAFTATKHAIYCYVHGVNPDNYSAIGSAGKRTLKAMKKIIENAQNSNETKIEASISINKSIDKWKVDSIDKNYVSKTYAIDANADYKKYTISIEKKGDVNLPEGLRLTGTDNKDKTTFKKGEEFKVLIPIRNLKNNGEFKLSVKAEMNTKPVLYGRAPSSNLQDYALTTLKYEDGKGSTKDSYKQNTTQIVVYKKEKNTNKSLEGVYFDLLDENKNVVKSALKTNNDGKITIGEMQPGKYYLRETSTLDGYVLYDQDIEINIELNEEFKVTVYNSKETKIEVEKSQKEVSVSKEVESKTVNEKTSTTEIENKEVNENINTSETENKQITENENKKVSEIVNTIETKNKNVNEEIEKEEIAKKLPVTGM